MREDLGRRRPPLLPPLRTLALVAAGGALGGLARAAVSTAFPVTPGTFPWSTFVENVTGAYLLALLLTSAIERLADRPWVLPLLGTGALGAYTTFATVSLELQQLLAVGAPLVAAMYAIVTVMLGVLAALLGMATARWLTQRAGGGRP